MTTATGNTYSVKENLKSCGFVWNKESKAWETENFDKDRWENKMCNPSWNGRKNARLCNEIIITEK